jgi:hypothetical protein
MQLDTATGDDFRPHLSSTFDFSADGSAPVPLTLAAVDDLAPGSPGRRLPFSLTFRGAGGLPQQTYRVEHQDLGTFDLFIVPLKPDATGPRYEAVFN